LWEQAREEIRQQMTRATFTLLLAGSRAVPEAGGPGLLVVRVRSRYAQEWLTARLEDSIAQTVSGIAGRPVAVCFAAPPDSLSLKGRHNGL
jgi:chromosomal replication initiation ATPase DnaA